MSDWEKSWEKKIEGKIEALEKKYKNPITNKMPPIHLMRYNHLKEKIEVLELAIKNSPPNSHLQIQISELEKKYKLQTIANGKFIEQIAELKDNIKANEKICNLGYQEHIRHLNTAFTKYDNLEEGLRELNQIVKGIAFDLNKGGSLTAYTYNHYRERLQKNEEKLDSPKKWIFNQEYTCDFIEPSGGEKELPNRENGLNHSYGINGEPNVHHSKLPEFIEKLEGLKYKLEDYPIRKEDIDELIEDSGGEKEHSQHAEHSHVNAISVAHFDSKLLELKIPSDFKGTWKEDLMYMVEANKTEPEKNIIGYIQEINGLESDIEYLKKAIEELEKEKEYYRIEANKDHKELIEELVKEKRFLCNKICRDYYTVIKNSPEYISPVFEMIEFFLNSRIKKWQGRIK